MLASVRRRRLALPERRVEIALLDWGGDGPLALLHHANGFCAGTWGLVAERLAPHFRVVAMDGRGHGDSTAPESPEAYAWGEFGADLAAVARALSRETGAPLALGLGNSFGGTSLVLAEAEEPGLFRSLVLVDPVLLPPPDAELRALAPGRAPQLVEATRRRTAVFPDRATARAAWAGKRLFAGWRPRALDLYVQEGLRDRPDGRVELKCAPASEAAVFANGARGSGVWEAARGVSTPTLVLWATRGDFPRPLFERFAARLPSARLADLGSGHLAPMEEPELVAAVARSFAAAAAAQRSTG